MPGIKVKLTYQLLYAFSQIVFPLITFPFLAKVIGPVGLGKVASVEYLSGFIIALAALGIPFLGVREIASVQNNAKKRRVVFSNLFSIHLLTSVTGILFFLLFIHLKEQVPPANLLLLGCVNVVLPVFVADWYFQGVEAFKFSAVRNMVVRAAGLGLILLFIKNTEDFIAYYAIVIGSQVIIALTSIWHIRFSSFAFRPVAAIKKYGNSLVPFFLTTSFISLYVFLDVIILGWVSNDQQVGYYSTALKIVKLTLFVTLSLSAVLFPRLSALAASGQTEESVTLINKSLQFTVIVTIPLCTLLYMLAPEIVSTILGSNFTPSLPLLRTLFLLPLIIGLSNVFAFQILLPFHKEKALLKAVIITTFCCIAINSFLATAFAAHGTATATVCTELCATFIMGYFAFQTIQFKIPYLQILQSVLSVVPVILIVLLSRYLLLNDIVIIIIAGFTLLLYAVIHLKIFKSVMAEDLLQHLKSVMVR